MESRSPLVDWYLRRRWMRCTHADAIARLDTCIVALAVAAAVLLR